MQRDNSIYGILYEEFINRAFGTYGSSQKNGANDSLFKGLVYAEGGTVKGGTPYDIQLSQIKSFMERAFKQYLLLQLSEPERIAINKQFALLIHSAKSSTDLLQIIEAVLEITDRFREAPRKLNS